MRVTRLILMTVAALALLAVGATGASAKSRDRNHDRIPDRWERHFDLSLKVNQANRDQDRDGLRNLAEFRSKTSPIDSDSDNNGIEDADENPDHDGVDNGNEDAERTSPRDADTDADGIKDGVEDSDRDGLRNAGEDRTGNNPTDRDTDNDGTLDGAENAGQIVSFDQGILTIGVANADPIKGLVTDATRIKCETEDEHESENEAGDDNGGATSARHGADDPAGDDHGGSPNSDSDDSNRGPGSDDNRDHRGDSDNLCATTDLTPGTVVHEAEARVTADGLVFTELELIK